MTDEVEHMPQGMDHPGHLYQEPPEAILESEVLLIKMVLVISGAAMIGGVAQAEVLIDLAGLFSLLVFLTAAAISLVMAVCGAYWMNQTRIWNLKGSLAKEQREQARRFERASRYRVAMRLGVGMSVVLIVLGFVQLIVFIWIVAPKEQSPYDTGRLEAMSTARVSLILSKK